MNNYEKILQLAKENNGYITVKTVEENKIARVYLSNLVKKKKLEHIDRGIYLLTGEIVDVYYKLQLINQNAVFSLATALYFHNLSDRIPLIIDLTVPHNYSGSLANNQNISLNYVHKNILHLGVITIKTNFNNEITIYDIDKTICDIIKNEFKIDAEIFSRALQLYVVSKSKNLNNLIKYSKQMKVEKKVNQYMKILL